MNSFLFLTLLKVPISLVPPSRQHYIRASVTLLETALERMRMIMMKGIIMKVIAAVAITVIVMKITMMDSAVFMVEGGECSEYGMDDQNDISDDGDDIGMLELQELSEEQFYLQDI